MSWSARRAIAILGATATVLGTLAITQLTLAQQDVPRRAPLKRPPRGVPLPETPPAQGPALTDSSELSGITLPTDDSLKGKIEDIKVFIEVKDWEKVVDRLQALLDRTDSVFAKVTSVDASGRKSTSARNVAIASSARPIDRASGPDYGPSLVAAPAPRCSNAPLPYAGRAYLRGPRPGCS